ncbi:MAG: nucleotidyltransferase domain-containing protein [Candidatus Tectomicrobia bacterium]|uniref:Nucleotidyltransferase domain-containing protein n=1 Tax=Tectimicrobiota bacterium TaxID=2528274 RepID=A0A933GL41_UNCTE|nr:nucleotidyltransferase domain-containing protein [Candidatus Tectomicrobia bacterium]
MLERLFSSKARVELLSALFLHPNREFYLREIARMTGEDYKGISLELKNLESIGLLTSRKAGNLKYFRLNKDFLIFEELKSIFFKTRGAAKLLKEVLLSAENIDYAFIYGSYASGKENEKSDVDLMVTGEIPLEVLLKLLKEPEKALSREINPSLYGLSEIERRLAERDPFITQVMNGPKIMLIGDESELRRTAA